MKLYTDRFETVLPPEVRERFRGRRCLVKPEPVLPEVPRALPKLSTLLEPPEGKKAPWVLLAWSVIVLLLGGILLLRTTSRDVPQKVIEVAAPPTPVATPQPEPTPFPHTELIDEVRKFNPSITVTSAPEPTPRSEPELLRMVTPAPEVRRADVLVQMPYGETLWARVLGRLPDQEHLPLAGNRVGDAYLIGPHEFVWTEAGQWIDPIVQ